jgi:penicillin-binding protein 2
VTSLVTIVLAGRLFDLQVRGREGSRDAAMENRIRRERVPAPRGLILDRHGKILADSRPSFTVLVEPKRALKNPGSAEYEETMATLARLRGVSESETRAWLQQSSGPSKRVVRRDVSFAEISRIAEIEGDLQGIEREVDHVRYYPEGTVAAHVLGHVGEISEEELTTRKEEGYRQGDFWGRTGLERKYEEALRGKAGERYFEVDAYGRVLGRFAGWDPEPPHPGETLRLNLDFEMQALAESLLVGRRGAIVVMDVNTGGIRVMASAPTFDPNLFTKGISAEDWNRLNTDPKHPLLNRAGQATYAPGSTFKMISFAMALEDKVIRYDAYQPVACRGGFTFGNRWFGCWEEIGHGWLDLKNALIQSCDTYFYQIGERVTVDQLATQARAAGFGQATGIDLPQELKGNVPTSEWLDRRYGARQWTQGTVLNLVIGQGEYLVTPLQMARYAAALGNGGRLVEPRLVDVVEGESGVIDKKEPVVTGEWAMSPLTRSRLEESMRFVVQGERGTARGCRIEGYPVAGKTGTAENPHGRPHSWFIGYAPLPNPEISFAIIVEAGGHGSDTAVPIAKKILTAMNAKEVATT